MPSKPYQILLIESDELSSDRIAAKLADAGDYFCEVHLENSLPNALTSIESSRFDLIFLSDRLPGARSDGAVKAFANHVRDIPVILLTDEQGPAYACNAVLLGVQDVLTRDEVQTTVLMRAICMAIVRQNHVIALDQRISELGATCSRYQDVLSDNEAALHTAELMAQRADFVKTRLFAGMSHELRTPLNSILGYAEAMKIGLFGPLGSHQYSKYIDHIHTSGQHLLELIDKLMDLSQAGTDTVELRDEVVDLVLLVRAAIGVLARNAGEKLVSVEFAHDQARLTVRGDGARLLQALLSILSNAIKFTEPGGVVTIALGDRGSHGVALTTTDTGIGISERDLQTIFEPFTNQVDGRTHVLQGAGLGLSLAKNMIELHEGSIVIDSHLSVGTVVTISLPRHRIIEKDINGEGRMTA